MERSNSSKSSKAEPRQKLKIFQMIQRHYVTLGVGSLLNQSTQKYPFIEDVFFGFSLYGCAVVSHFVYIFCLANGFMEYIVCICSTSATIIVFVCFAAIVFKKTLLFETIDSIEELIDSRCECEKSRRLFLETNWQVEQFSEIVFVLVAKMALQCVMLPKFIVSFGMYFITDSGSDSFQLPVPLWFPFDTNNPIGYFIAIILEYIVIGYEFFTIACTLALGIGAFWFVISMTKEIQRILHSVNDEAQANKNQSNEFKSLLSEYINIHSATKQIEHDLSIIFQPIILSLFTWSLIAISGAMLIIQVEIVHHVNVMPLLLTILSGIFSLITVFIACEIGQRINDAFDGISSTIEEFDWYLYSIELKRILPLIMANAQKPVKLECFGSITCSREVFRKINRCAFSYFMVLRRIGN